MRWMGLDYGSKTVGVAVTDALGITVMPLETITRGSENKLRRTCVRIEELVKEYNIELIVLGRPLNMDGSEGERVRCCEEFKAMLDRRIGIEIAWQDERLTTLEANEILSETNVKKEDRKKYIDQVAAQLILEDYISCIKNKKEN